VEHLFLILMLVDVAQPVLGPITACPVVVEVVDPAWAPLPGIKVTLRDERTKTEQVAQTTEDGTTRFVVQSCADHRCRFTMSAVGDAIIVDKIPPSTPPASAALHTARRYLPD
jgi:hypothetical protein